MGVSTLFLLFTSLNPKCDMSERARLRSVLIMIVNNNRARHRRLPDVTRASHRLDGARTTVNGRDGLGRPRAIIYQS